MPAILLLLLPGIAYGQTAEQLSLDELIEALQDNDPAARQEALAGLNALGPQAVEAVGTLTGMLDDPRAHVRLAAADALRQIGPTAFDAAPALIRRLDDRGSAEESRPVWAAAAAALGRLGPQITPQLIALLESPEVQQRRAAAVAVHELGADGAAAVPALIKLLKEDTPQTRTAAMFAVMGIGPEAAPAVPVLIPLLSNEDFHTQYWACRALGRIGPPAALEAVPRLVELLDDKVTSVRGNAALALGAIGPEAGKSVVMPLAELLSDFTVTVQQRAATALGDLGPLAGEAVPALEAALDNPRFKARVPGAVALWQITGHSERATQVLLEELCSPDAPWEAAQGFAALGPQAEEAVPELITFLDSDSYETRLFAIDALASIGAAATTAFEALEQRLEDEQPDVRAAAQQAIDVIRAAKPE